MIEEKESEGRWLTGRYAFVEEPGKDSNKIILFMEWLCYIGDEEEPSKRRLTYSEAYET